MPEIELSSGPIEYHDTGGEGPVIVFTHGLMMDASVWRKVVADLRSGHRCILPVLPFGGHRKAMNADGDLTMDGIVGLLGEFIEALDLRDIVLVMNDWGGSMLLVGGRQDARIAKLVLCACEAFDNVPPKGPARLLPVIARIPGGLAAALFPFRFHSLRRLPMTYGWMSRRPVPREVIDRWFEPVLTRREIRRDLAKYVVSAAAGRRALQAGSAALAGFDRPALVVWATEDRMMPREHGRRLAELLPHGRLLEIEDSYTLIPEDQPERLSSELRAFVAEPVPA